MAVKISDLPQASNVASTDVLVANVGDATSKLPYSVVQTSIRSLAWCGTAGGTANAITLSPSPAISAYQAGQAFDFVAAATNTGPVTVSISGLSAISVTRGGAAIPASTILAGRAYRIVVTSGSSAELGTDPEGLPRQQVLTFGATTNWDASLGQVAVLTLSGNTTLAAPTNLKAGGHYTLRVVQDSVGGRTITWNSAYVGVRGAAMPQPASAANTTTVYHFVSDGTRLFLVSLSGFPNDGLKIQDTDASHTLALVPASNLTADRRVSIVTGDTDRTLDLLAMSNGLAPPAVAVNLKANNSGANAVNVTANFLVLRNPTTGQTRLFSNVSVTANITASGAGGLDTGTEAANTWYYVYVIAKDDGTLNALLSTSATAPTMPPGYTMMALVSAVRNNGSSNFINYYQRGAHVYLTPRQRIVTNGTATVETSVSVESAVPAIAPRILVEVELYVPKTASATADVYCEARYSSGTGGFFTTAGLTANGTSSFSSSWSTKEDWIPHVTSQTIYYLLSTSTGGPTVHISIHGFSLPVGGE